MRIWTKFAVALALAGCASAVGTAPAMAQTPEVPVKIGVVDVGYILDNYPAMKSQLEAIDQQIKGEEEKINSQRETVLKELDKLREFREDTAEYKQQEDRIAKMEAELKLDFMRKEKEFNEARAAILAGSYKQVQNAVKQMADYHKIAVVLRYSRTEMDPKKPATVTGGLGRDLVYFNASVDMTDGVMQLLQIPAKTAAAPTAAPTATR